MMRGQRLLLLSQGLVIAGFVAGFFGLIVMFKQTQNNGSSQIRASG